MRLSSFLLWEEEEDEEEDEKHSQMDDLSATQLMWRSLHFKDYLLSHWCLHNGYIDYRSISVSIEVFMDTLIHISVSVSVFICGIGK